MQVVKVHTKHTHGVREGPGQAVEHGEGADGYPAVYEEDAAHQEHGY